MNEILEAFIARVTLELGNPEVYFRAGSRRIKVHKKVLEKSSPVLKAKLSDVWQTSGDVLQLDEEYVEPEVVEELLVWLYDMYRDLEPRCTIKDAYFLCIAAHYLMISELVTSCCDKLRQNITPENFYDLFTLSKHLHLDNLRKACEWYVANRPKTFFLSSQVVKWKAEELKMFIEMCLKVEQSSTVCETILLSMDIWAKKSFENRLGELEQFFKIFPPDTLSSESLFRFMNTELYSRLDESRQKQYLVRAYLPTEISHTDKLYCIRQTISSSLASKVNCLDLSAGGKWYLPAGWLENFRDPFFVVSWRKEIYFFTFGALNIFDISVFSAKNDEWLTSKLIVLPGSFNQQMLAGAALNGYVYMTVGVKRLEKPFEVSSRRVIRYNLETNRKKILKDMQTARLAHQLVALEGFLYAIGGEVRGHESTNSDVNSKKPKKKQFASYLSSRLQKMLGFASTEKNMKISSSLQSEPDRSSGPERYNPQTDRWEYIEPLNYHHQLPTTVAHEGQIYVLSRASFEAYSPETDRWTRLPVPEVCIGPSLVSIAGRLWLLTDSAHCSHITSGLVYEFDVVKQEWIRLPDFPENNFSSFHSFVVKQ